MMEIMEKWADELPPFRKYLDHKFKYQKTSYFNDSSDTKVVPLVDGAVQRGIISHQSRQ